MKLLQFITRVCIGCFQAGVCHIDQPSRSISTVRPYSRFGRDRKIRSAMLEKQYRRLAQRRTIPSTKFTAVDKLGFRNTWVIGIETCNSYNFILHTQIDLYVYFNAFRFLLANYKVKKFILYKNNQYAKNRVSGSHRLDILRTFYHQAVETFVLSSESDCDVPSEDWKFIGARETYLCSEYHKCYAVKHGDHIFCILYASSVPTHTMRLVCRKVLKTLLVDKQGCW